MSHQPQTPPRHNIPTPLQLTVIILLLLGVVMWIILILLAFELQGMVDKNLRLIMELAEIA
jgi:hypothetical protein